jgi:hypothetical protein
MASEVLTIAGGTAWEEQEVSSLLVCLSAGPSLSYTDVPADANDTATLRSVLIEPGTLLVFVPATRKNAFIYNCMALSHINQN